MVCRAPPEQPQENAEVQADAPIQNEEHDPEEPDMWEETFKSHTDSKPNGN